MSVGMYRPMHDLGRMRNNRMIQGGSNAECILTRAGDGGVAVIVPAGKNIDMFVVRTPSKGLPDRANY